HRQDPELGRVGLSDDDRARFAQPANERGVGVRDPVTHRVHAHRGADALGERDQVLDRDWNARKRPVVTRPDRVRLGERTLPAEEKLRLLDVVLDEVGEDATVIAGTGSNDTAHSVHLTGAATAHGAHAVLVVTPYYNKPSRRGLKAHFEAVAGATDRPVIV